MEWPPNWMCVICQKPKLMLKQKYHHNHRWWYCHSRHIHHRSAYSHNAHHYHHRYENHESIRMEICQSVLRANPFKTEQKWNCRNATTIKLFILFNIEKKPVSKYKLTTLFTGCLGAICHFYNIVENINILNYILIWIKKNISLFLVLGKQQSFIV